MPSEIELAISQLEAFIKSEGMKAVKEFLAQRMLAETKSLDTVISFPDEQANHNFTVGRINGMNYNAIEETLKALKKKVGEAQNG